MISVENLGSKLEEILVNSSIFVVDIKVSSTNDIVIEIDDREKSIDVKDCISVSKELESKLDREEEDFSLLVSSPGLSNPFKVIEQYLKNVGREVRVLKKDGIVHKGLMINANDKEITLQNEVKERIEGRKAKIKVVKEETISYDEIKETTIIISFK